MRLLLHWLINALALFALPYIFTSITVDSFVTALVVALVLGLINTLIRPLLVILTLPVTIADARPLHLRHQRPPVLGRGVVRAGFPRGGLLVGRVRRDRLQPHLVGAVGADPEEGLTAVRRR